MDNPGRITVFAGHYGSGKTQLAVNYALWLRRRAARVLLVDLDIVNPYFRTTDADALLREHDVTLIASRFANSNVDAPSLPPDTQRIFDDPDAYGVLDVGGDERGALALGRYAGQLAAAKASCYMVINRFRPHTRDIDGLLEMRREIESAAHIRFTGLVHNSHLSNLTTAHDLLESEKSYALPASEACGLPIVMTGVREDLYDEVADRVTNPFPLRLFSKESWRL